MPYGILTPLPPKTAKPPLPIPPVPSKCSVEKLETSKMMFAVL